MQTCSILLLNNNNEQTENSKNKIWPSLSSSQVVLLQLNSSAICREFVREVWHILLPFFPPVILEDFFFFAMCIQIMLVMVQSNLSVASVLPALVQYLQQTVSTLVPSQTYQ